LSWSRRRIFIELGKTGTNLAATSRADVVRLAARAHERDRYLSALLAPRAVRDDLIALAAFAGEIARIPAVVHEPLVGEIRFQWWRDALEALGRGEKSGHPIADAVGAARMRHRLPQGLLHGVIDAHTVGLYEEPLPDDPALWSFLAKTEGAMFGLGLSILGRNDASFQRAADAAGRAYGLARVLVELPALWSQGRTLLPESRLHAAGLSLADAKAGAAAARLRPVVRDLAEEAREQLAKAREGWRRLAVAGRAALLPLALVEPYLRALERPGRDLLREPVDILPLRRVWQLWWARRSGSL
jgi:phytoene synthase